MNHLRFCVRLAILSGISFVAPTQAQDYAWTTNASWTIAITAYTGPGGNVIIPDTITGLPVTEIRDDAFYGRGSVTSVTIGDSVTSIGTRVFYNCDSLTNVAVGEGVTSVGVRSFGLCDSLTVVTLGESVSTIGDEAFYFCTNLTEIAVNPANFFYSSLDGVLFNKSQTTLIQYPAGKSGHYDIPNSVTRIGDGALYYCPVLSSVTIPDSVTSIGHDAFGLCFDLAGVTIGNSVTSIGDSAFYYCTSLTGVYFRGDAPALGSSVFSDADNATLYYLPGTTGWGSTFGGRPTVLWLPRMQAADVQGGQFGFDISWADGMTVVIEACNNLAIAGWASLGTNTLTAGPLYFSDPDWTNHPARLYRLRWP